jgi:hypothetical protein
MELCNETATLDIIGREGQQDADGAVFGFPVAIASPLSCGEACNGDF